MIRTKISIACFRPWHGRDSWKRIMIILNQCLPCATTVHAVIVCAFEFFRVHYLILIASRQSSRTNLSSIRWFADCPQHCKEACRGEGHQRSEGSEIEGDGLQTGSHRLHDGIPTLAAASGSHLPHDRQQGIRQAFGGGNRDGFFNGGVRRVSYWEDSIVPHSLRDMPTSARFGRGRRQSDVHRHRGNLQAAAVNGNCWTIRSKWWVHWTYLF